MIQSERFHGHNSKTSEGRHEFFDEAGQRKEAQVLFAQAQPLPHLRTSTRVSAQVRHLPAVFPRAGAAGRNSRGFEVILVDTEMPALQASAAVKK
jgi:hypothetical protein